ncbi:hypothetical protein [Sphingopyxis sp.]|jgi:hypothetical protein|uniref:hypothetical protein n=1 Tax=Sphingopyxis sp. TaxID=1908224 RepID=UPI003F70C5FB
MKKSVILPLVLGAMAGLGACTEKAPGDTVVVSEESADGAMMEGPANGAMTDQTADGAMAHSAVDDAKMHGDGADAAAKPAMEAAKK